MTVFGPDDDQGRSRWIWRTLGVLLALFALLGILDLVLDSPRVWRSGHALVELALVVTAILAALVVLRGWREAEASLRGARALADIHRIERDEWERRAKGALEGFVAALDHQFDAWALTPAEKETALFLLKGYSHKDAATRAGRSERTVRQHAVSVYRKSGLSGRAQFAAFFFDGMILPSRPSDPPAA